MSRFFSSWLRKDRAVERRVGKPHSASPARTIQRHLEVEALEGRWLPSCNTISGYVFQDLNNNGVRDSGEDPIANSTIQLVNSQNQVVGTATTDDNGYYEFAYDSTIPTTPATLTETLTFNNTQTNFSKSGTVGQFDSSLGQLQSIEIIHNAHLTTEIKVENTSPLSGSNITGTVSGSMTLVGPGINQTISLSENVGTFTATVYDNNPDFGGSSGISFAPATADKTQSLTLTGADMNAFIGTGTVSLTESATASSFANGGGNLVVSLSSSASAEITVIYHYLPSNCLQPGDYTIVQTQQPANYFDGKESSNGVVLNTPPGFDAIPVTLADVDLVNNNFAELPKSNITGYVFEDTNNNGIKDSGEQGIVGQTVKLEGITDSGTITPLFATTDSSGKYQFLGLRAGTYTITETQPSSYLDGKDTPGSNTTTVSNDKFSNLVLTPGQTSANNNFGELKPGSLSGFVYHDINNNGIKDSGEQGISGVSITLTGVDDNGAVSLTATTDGTGAYSFGNLRPGTYAIQEVSNPSGYLDGKDTPGSNTITTTNDRFSNIVLTSGSNIGNNNFGEIKTTGISGYVYLDANNNGVKDGNEQGVFGATVTLTGTNDQGSVSQTVNTDTNGFYSFANLRPGTYTVTETQPSGLLDGKDSTGSNTASVGNDVISNIVLASGSMAENNNFGELQPASISGTVFVDSNDNGVKDSGENGIGGVTITLTGTDDLGSVSKSVVTSSNGTYSFTGLRPGTYTVQETQPITHLDGKDHLGSLGGTIFNNLVGVNVQGANFNYDQMNGIILTQGASGTAYDFGELLKPSITGYVYTDTNDNGVKDAGELGISGVTVTLTGFDTQGPVNLTAATNSDGQYFFQNLLPGVYSVTETQPSNYNDGKDTVGSAGGIITINDQIDNIALAGGVAGTGYNFGEQSKEAADLKVVKTANVSSVLVGGSYTYTLTISNLGTSTAQGVSVTDVLPPGVTVVTWFGTGWTITSSNGTLTATMPTLAAGAFATITISVKAPLVVGTLTNNVTVTSVTPDPDTTNNTSTNVILVHNQPGEVFPKTIVPLVTTFGDIPIISKAQLITGGNANLPASVRANLAFIDGTYRTLTGQPVDKTTALSLMNQLQAGTLTRSALVDQLWNSDAHRSLQAVNFYQTFYDRDPTSSELQSTIALLKSGVSELDVAKTFLTSSEYLTLHPTAESMILGIHEDVLKQVPDLLTLLSTVQTLASSDWTTYVQGVLQSTESLTEIVDHAFRYTLRRVPTAQELQMWLGMLQSNTATPASMAKALMSSDEFYALALASTV